jgi:DNA-binding protein H-NS
LAVSPISSQVSSFIQSVSAASSTSDTTSFSSTPVTSSNPVILTQQEKTVQNEISQLQQSHGSNQDIQNLNQELETIQKDLQNANSTTNELATQQTAAAGLNALDVKA